MTWKTFAEKMKTLRDLHNDGKLSATEAVEQSRTLINEFKDDPDTTTEDLKKCADMMGRSGIKLNDRTN